MQDEGDLEALPTLHSYAPVTRRKFFHRIEMPDGTIAYVTQRITDAMWWLEREGWSRYRLKSDRGTFLVYAQRERQQKEG